MEHHEISISGAEHQVEVEMPKASGETNVPSKPLRFSCNHVCSFSNQEQNVSDAEQRSKSKVKLCGLIIFYLIVMAVEIVGGLKANSLAVVTDAAHLLTDVAGFAISLFTLWASGWAATSQQSFGFNRIEVLGALISVQLIWVISGFLIYEALDRILQKRAKVDGELMFAIAAFGFVINFIMVMWLGHDHGHSHGHGHSHSHDHGHSHHTCMDKYHDHESEKLCSHGHVHGHSHHTCLDKDHDHEKEEEESTSLMPSSQEKSRKMNINIEGAYLHVISDMIQSVGVMIAGMVIWAKPDWLLVDLIFTLIFSILSLGTTLPMLKSIFSILMERSPSEVDVAHLEMDLKCIKGVSDVHDLHVWEITVGKFVLACHVIVVPNIDSNEILHKVRDLCERTYGIHHVTVQIEQE